MLILISNPRSDLKLKREIEDLKNAIKRSQNQSKFKMEFVSKQKTEKETRELLQKYFVVWLGVIYFSIFGS